MSIPAHSAPAPGGERRAALIAAGLLTSGFLSLWLLLPDKTFVLDGVMFSNVIERGVSAWRQELFNPRHFLFNAALQLLRDGLGAAGVAVGAYRLVQIVNAFAGAAGLWLFGCLLRRLVDDDAVAVWGAALLGASWTYGTRATEGQVYMLLGLGGLWTLWEAARLLEEPTVQRGLRLAAAFAVATLFHAAAAFLAPAVCAALWFAFRGRRARMLPALALGAALVLIPYGVQFGGEGLRGFLSGATDYRRADERGYWTGLFLRYWTNGGLNNAGRLLLSWVETGRAFVLMPETAAAEAGLVLWLAVSGALIASWGKLDLFRRRLAVVLTLAWAGFLFLNAFWVGGLYFAVIPAACLLGLLGAAAGPFVKTARGRARRRMTGTLAASALALAAWNAAASLRPQSRVENNASYDQALFLKAHTVPSSYIVIAGHVNANLKVYIPTFARRPREALEYYFLSNSKEEGLRLLAGFVSSRTRFGVPLYILGDVVEDARAQEQMLSQWDVSPEDIRRAFGPGRLLALARRPDTSLYLFVPTARRPELFAGLSYSILTEGDAARLKESVFAASAIARLMSPAERRRAAELLLRSESGFHLMEAGFADNRNDATPEASAGRLARFRALERQAGFRLRAGKLYQTLGLKPGPRNPGSGGASRPVRQRLSP